MSDINTYQIRTNFRPLAHLYGGFPPCASSMCLDTNSWHVFIPWQLSFLYNLKDFVMTTVILAPVACRTWGQSCRRWTISASKFHAPADDSRLEIQIPGSHCTLQGLKLQPPIMALNSCFMNFMFSAFWTFLLRKKSPCGLGKPFFARVWCFLQFWPFLI